MTWKRNHWGLHLNCRSRLHKPVTCPPRAKPAWGRMRWPGLDCSLPLAHYSSCLPRRRNVRKFSLNSIARLLWALVLVTLPVTSFRYVPFMGEGTYVRPLALYPLTLLWPVLLIRLKQGRIVRPWHGTLTILLAFVLAVLASTSLGATLSPLELRGVEYSGRAIRALLT